MRDARATRKYLPMESPASNLTLKVNPNKALWEKGDFTRIADTMRESGEALVQGFGITKGMKVLDLGCGDGTTALPAAKLGADVVGVDIAATWWRLEISVHEKKV